MTSDIETRLREMCDISAARSMEITRLRSLLADAAAAMKPFARAAKHLDQHSNERIFSRGDFAGHDFREIFESDLLRAAEVLKRMEMG